MNNPNLDSIVIIGDFAKGEPVYSGQTAKVRDYYYYIGKQFKEKSIRPIDTRNWKRQFFKVLFSVIAACKECKCVVLLLCGNGKSIKTLFPLIMFLKKIYGFPVFFSIVGGGILQELETNRHLLNRLTKVDYIYVETKTLLSELSAKGIRRIKYAPVFSKRNAISFNELNTDFNEPYRFCTYSRVTKEKGISDAIEAVIEVNDYFKRKVCVLDIYGNPTDEYKEEFEKLVSDSNGVVTNQPLLTDNNAIKELSNHYLMLFPTYYPGEGFPIALIECFKAGLPVVANDWHFNSEIIRDNKTGILYKRDSEKLSGILIKLIENKQLVCEMKKECLKEAENYDPDNILKDLYERISDLWENENG